MEAAATPLPSEETTPPVTKIYFGPVRKGLDFLQKEWRYDLLSGETEKLSKGKIGAGRVGKLNGGDSRTAAS
jgi:hypothetical protein